MKHFIAGFVSFPIVVYVFRRPIANVTAPLIGSEELNEALYKFMQRRNDYQDRKKKENDDQGR